MKTRPPKPLHFLEYSHPKNNQSCFFLDPFPPLFASNGPRFFFKKNQKLHRPTVLGQALPASTAGGFLEPTESGAHVALQRQALLGGSSAGDVFFFFFSVRVIFFVVFLKCLLFFSSFFVFFLGDFDFCHGFSW